MRCSRRAAPRECTPLAAERSVGRTLAGEYRDATIECQALDDDPATHERTVTPVGSARVKPVDRLGQRVSLGTRVRVLEVSPFLKDSLPADEWQRLETMVGEVFDVYEIDEYGWAWVEKWFESGEDGRNSHFLALAANEMEVVS
jgi:hypothetical protein